MDHDFILWAQISETTAYGNRQKYRKLCWYDDFVSSLEKISGYVS